MKPPLSPVQLAFYEREGYLLVPGYWSRELIGFLYELARTDEAVSKHALDLNDQSGRKTRLTLWFTPGNDPFGYLTRTESLVQHTHQLLGGSSELCHFHSKLMQKEPQVGGAWEWHQDYGYWYKNQFMFPDQMISVMTALTQATEENGCLQIIPGSHKMGRVNHGFSGEQVGADAVMVENALKTMTVMPCVLEPGDVLFFHPNLLHCSAPNLSDAARWSIISCYNLASNPAYQESSTSWKLPLQTVPDEAVTAWDAGNLDAADFLKKEADPALKKTGWEEQVKTKS
jgi:hypothetical protein